MARIPNKLHFIWVGTDLPEKYATNLLKWRFANPEYEMYLWTESNTFSNKSFTILRLAKDIVNTYKVASTQIVDEVFGIKLVITKQDNSVFGINMYTIGAVPLLGDPSLLHEELHEWKNYGAASDMLRLSIIHEYGGIYMDFDTYMDGDKPLPVDIEAPLGLLLCENRRQELLFAIVAAVPKDSRVHLLAQKHDSSYLYDYPTVRDGVRTVAPETEERLLKVRALRSVLPYEDDMSWEVKQKFKTDFWENFTAPTAKRFSSTNREVGNIGGESDRPLLSFQRQSGYSPVVRAEGSWVK